MCSSDLSAAGGAARTTVELATEDRMLISDLDGRPSHLALTVPVAYLASRDTTSGAAAAGPLDVIFTLAPAP